MAALRRSSAIVGLVKPPLSLFKEEEEVLDKTPGFSVRPGDLREVFHTHTG